MNFSNQTAHYRPISVRAIQGALIATVLLTAFFFLNPGILEDRIITSLRLIVFVPVGGALGGVMFFLTDKIRCKGPVGRVIANMVSISSYLILFVMTFAAGLNGF